MNDGASIVAAARALVEDVRAHRDDAERLRHTPDDLAAAITRAGIYQMYLPRSMGGPEATPLEAFDSIEALSIADGSVGWCGMIAIAMSFNAARLPAESSPAPPPITAPPDRRAPADVPGWSMAAIASKAGGTSPAGSPTRNGCIAPA
jgi:alkylation response protein AidB-like acyl-CoA dehydrogenase